MPTVQQLASTLIRKTAAGLARNLEAMPADRQVWRPLDEGRSALDQVQECSILNNYTAHTLAERSAPPLDRDDFVRRKAELDTVEKALAALHESVNHLAGAIEAFPDGELDTSVTLPIGPGLTMPYAEVMLLPYWNMTYHVGQVNYIQTLYGDREMH